jgi:Flp pilus assembly protein TadD
MICLFLIVATIAVYWQVANHDFLNYDDREYVTGNYHVQAGLTWEGIIWAFTTFHATNWHPLAWLSHMLDCQIYGLNAGGHHLTNLLIHVVNALLLFVLLKRMTGALWRSAFVAALFALHPLHVESVAWVAERKDVLSTFFWITTTWAYVHYVEHPRFGTYLLVLVSFALGLMAKPMLVTLPFVLLLLDYWPLQRYQFGHSEANPRKSINNSHQRLIPLHLIREKVPFFVLAAASSVVTFLAQQSGGAVTPLDKLALSVRMANALVSYVSYMGKMIWPIRLAVIYPHPGTLPIWQAAAAGLLLVCISVFVIRTARRSPYLAVGWLWYLGTLVPVIGVVQVGKQCMADRYTYVPLIGLFVIIAWGIADVAKRWSYQRLVLAISTGVVLLALMVCTWFQVTHWRDSISLFTHTLDVTGENYEAHNNLGVARGEQGRFKEAVGHFSKALQIMPNYAVTHNNIGSVLARRGNLEEAIGHFSKALQLDPRLAEAHICMGVALSRQGSVNGAIDHFSRALEIRPDNVELRNNLGVALARQGRLDEAIDHFSRALRVKPDNLEVRSNLIRALRLAGKSEMTVNRP